MQISHWAHSATCAFALRLRLKGQQLILRLVFSRWVTGAHVLAKACTHFEGHCLCHIHTCSLAQTNYMARSMGNQVRRDTLSIECRREE